MTRPPLDELLKEFERLSLDEQLFWQFKNDEELDVCVMFRRHEPRSWSFWLRLSPEASKQTCSSVHVSHVLRAFRVEEKTFEDEICGALLVQAAYADEFIHQVSGIVGEKAVQTSISETQTFIKDLSQTIGQLLSKKNEDSSSNIPVINETSSSASESKTLSQSTIIRQHLRIIKK